MTPTMGRPKSETPKDKLLQVRMDEATMTVLDSCAKQKQTSRAEIVREGIALVKASLDHRTQK